MDIIKKIDELRIQKGWSINKLATEAMLTQSTVANMFNFRSEPKISTLKAICDAFEITLSEFFYEKSNVEISPKSLNLLYSFEELNENEKEIVLNLVKLFCEQKKK